MSRPAKRVSEMDEDEFVREFMERARYDLLNVATRIMEVVARYFQYRVREVLAQGLTFTYTHRVEYSDRSVRVVMEILIPDELLERYMESYGRMAKIVRSIMRRGKIVDRYLTRARQFEDSELEDVEVELVEPAPRRDKDSGSEQALREAGGDRGEAGGDQGGHNIEGDTESDRGAGVRP